MFSEFPKLFDRNFAVGYLLPSMILLLGLQGLLSAFQIATIPSFLTDTNPIVGSAVVVLIGWLIGILLLGANRDIIRTFEGYGKFNPLRLFVRLQVNKYRNLQKRIELLKGILKRNLQEEEERKRLLREAVTNFPDQEIFILPTSFGNAIRAFEVYPRLMYGVESVVLWSRLLTVMPEEYKAHIDNTKAHMDFWVNLSVSSMLLLASSIGMRIYSNYYHIAVNPVLFWLWIVVGLALIFFCQFRATRSAIVWGQTVKAAFDVFLPDLAKKIGLVLPDTREAQRTMWERYCIAILYARKDYLPEVEKEKVESVKPAEEGLLSKILKLFLGS